MKNYKIFEAFKTNSAGVWYFVPAEGSFKEGKPCKGFGCIKYAEGSLYTGDVYYDGKYFNKLGLGQQDFSRSTLGGLIPEIDEKRYKFSGCYDYRKTGWISGNGVLYFTYADGTPSHFIKGSFLGLDKAGECEGEFDYSTLLDGYTAEMEFDFDVRAVWLEKQWNRIADAGANAQSIKVLFIGDSYFELSDNPDFAGNNLFKAHFSENYVNIGIGGTRFDDWLAHCEKIKNFPAPEKIVINLGFNDLHSGSSAVKVYSDFKKFLKILRGYFPEAKIYLISVVHSPNHTDKLEEEGKYNVAIKENAVKNGVTVGEWNSLISASKENCFHADAVHPNERGYGLFRRFIEDLLNG